MRERIFLAALFDHKRLDVVGCGRHQLLSAKRKEILGQVLR